MGTDIILKAINEYCKDDETLRSLLIELLDFNLTGAGRYKEPYKDLIEKYIDIDNKEINNEN